MPTDRIADPETAAVVAVVGHRLSVDVSDAAVLHRHSNTVIALPSLGWVVRIATASGALPRIAASVRVTRWLATRGYPCVRPVESVDQPFVVRGRVVTLWHLVPTVDAPAPTGTELGRLLNELHAQAAPPFPLARFTDPFDDVAATVARTPDAMRPAQRSWLVDRIADLRNRWRLLPFTRPWGLIHGDAHPNNEMRTRAGDVVLGDWDHTAIGPREWDLAQIHYTRRRFRRPEAVDLANLARSYGWDIREWEGLDTVITAREITGLSPYIRTARFRSFSRGELRHRLDTLLDGDADAVWHMPPRN